MGGSGERRLPVCGRAGAQAVPGPAERTGLRPWPFQQPDVAETCTAPGPARILSWPHVASPLRRVVPVLIGDPLSLNPSARMIDAPFRSPLLW